MSYPMRAGNNYSRLVRCFVADQHEGSELGAALLTKYLDKVSGPSLISSYAILMDHIADSHGPPQMSRFQAVSRRSSLPLILQ